MKLLRILRTYHQVKPQWEEICRHCGMCCYEREDNLDGTTSIDLSSPCENLDTETNRCRIYARRLQDCERCHKVTLRIAAFTNQLPSTCAYRQLFR